MLTSAKNNIDRLSRIINDLLDISKIEAGAVRLHKKPINIAKLIHQTVVSFASEAEKKRIDIQTDLPSGEIITFADADKIIQILTNLIGNALKFTEKGQVTIALEEKKDTLLCSVRDSGVGIAPEERINVFNKFHQIARKHGSGAKGTGLGLPISKELVALHKGTLSVESELLKGSTFTFTIPKMTGDQVFRETLHDTIAESIQKNTPLYLITIHVIDFKSISKQKVSAQQTPSSQELFIVP